MDSLAIVLVSVGRSIFWAPPAFHWMRLWPVRLIASVFAAAFLVVLVSPFFAIRRPKARAAVRKAFSKLDFFVPIRPGEFSWFGAACITAGICEEWLARGFFFRYFGQTPWHWGIPVAFVIASLIFGINHVYQGPSGAISATFIGIAMGLLYLWTGSLLLPMIAHALIDLRALFLVKAVHSHPIDSEDPGLTPAWKIATSRGYSHSPINSSVLLSKSPPKYFRMTSIKTSFSFVACANNVIDDRSFISSGDPNTW